MRKHNRESRESRRQQAKKHEHDLGHGKDARFTITFLDAVDAQEWHVGEGNGGILLLLLDRLLDEQLHIDLVALTREHLDVAGRMCRDGAQREVHLAHRRRDDGPLRAVDDADGSLHHHSQTKHERKVIMRTMAFPCNSWYSHGKRGIS